MKIDLNSKRALVGGSSQGIGEAIAKAFAAAGATVTLVARNEDKLGSVLNELPGEGHTMICQDVNDRAALKEKIQHQIDVSGGYDILVCNTAGPKAGPVSEADDAEFIAGFENHVLVNSMLARLCLPHMKDRQFGRILNIISTSVYIPIPNLGVSNTIRGAVASWAKTLSTEVASHGITVNNLLPGYTQTGRLDNLLQNYQQKTGKSWDESVEDWKNRVPMRRFGDPSEIANLATFLASDKASYITGTSIAVDGGRMGCI